MLRAVTWMVTRATLPPGAARLPSCWAQPYRGLTLFLAATSSSTGITRKYLVLCVGVARAARGGLAGRCCPRRLGREPRAASSRRLPLRHCCVTTLSAWFSADKTVGNSGLCSARAKGGRRPLPAPPFRPRAAEHQVVVAHVLGPVLGGRRRQGQRQSPRSPGCAQRQVAQRRGGAGRPRGHIHVTARKHPRQCQRKRIIAA